MWSVNNCDVLSAVCIFENPICGCDFSNLSIDDDGNCMSLSVTVISVQIVIDLIFWCVFLPEKNSRSSPRSLGHSPGKMLTKSCPCCVESSPAVRKRLARHFDDDADDEIADTDRKRMRLSPSSNARLVEVNDSAGKVDKNVVSSVGRNMTAGIVRRGRGRPCKVSCLQSIL